MSTTHTNFKSTQYLGYWVLALTLLACVITYFIPAVSQSLSYHLFSDARHWKNLPNAANVASNIPFLIVGVLGLIKTLKTTPPGLLASFKYAYVLFFVGVLLTGIGSSYYHLSPNNQTLVWDRLPMTLSFMPFFSIIWAENLSENTAKKLLFPLMLVGLFSVIYWQITESNGQGDLRLYALVQFLPMIIIPIILIVGNSPFTSNFWVWALILCYILAKVFEAADTAIFNTVHFISGHSIKHLVAALGTYCFYLALVKRQFRAAVDES